jgi:hypothetical protein
MMEACPLEGLVRSAASHGLSIAQAPIQNDDLHHKRSSLGTYQIRPLKPGNEA